MPVGLAGKGEERLRKPRTRIPGTEVLPAVALPELLGGSVQMDPLPRELRAGFHRTPLQIRAHLPELHAEPRLQPWKIHPSSGTTK